MKLLDTLDRKLGRFAVPNLTVILIAGQSLFYVMYLTGRLERGATDLSASLLMEGEWWRLVAFPFDPPRQGVIFTLLAWYFFYLMGSTLEQHWGAFRYNVYLLLGCLMTVAVSFLVPEYTVTNTFVAGSVFLAFATLFPEFQVLLFFVLPVRIKWLALLTWLAYGYEFCFGAGATRLAVLAATGNFLLFFARDIFLGLRAGKRQMVKKTVRLAQGESKLSHRCTVCGITDKTHPHMDFRYCPQCEGQRGYCQEHIFSHQHVKKK